MKKKNSSVSVFKVSLIALIISGCSASGPLFKSVNPIPANKGVVYIYRQSSFVGGGVFGTVTANKTPFTKIKNGGYYPYIANAGLVNFEVTTEAANDADVIVEVGKEKYLKTTVGMGFVAVHLKFTEVSPEIGKSEISECRLLDSLSPENE